MKFDCLFEPGYIGSLRIENRFVQSPMESQTTTLDHTFSDQSIAYFVGRTKGGFGLQFTDYMAVSPDGLGVSNECGWWDDSFIESHKRLADAVHENGGKIFAQLHHQGMMCDTRVTEMTVHGPSSMPAAGKMQNVKAFSTEECYEVVENFGKAALRAKKAGFDGVEIHGAHFYLLGQFMSKYANKRVDEFGGDYTGRFRLSKLCIEKVKEVCGDDYPVSFRISTEEFLDGGTEPMDAVIYSQMAEDAGADVINISVGSGIGGNIAATSYFNPGWNLKSAKMIKENVSIPTIVVGRINDPMLAKYIIQNKMADFVALGRQSVADSEFVNKVKENRLNEIIQCAGCLQRCWYAKGCEEDDKGISCILNPFSGKENRWKIIEACDKKKIAIIGGGVAGLECAWVLGKRGHEVTVYEKQGVLGGNFRLAAIPPHKNDFAKSIYTYASLCTKFGVHIQMNTEIDEEMLETLNADAIVLATGAKPLTPPIQGLQSADIKYADEILDGKVLVGNKKVLIMGGGLVGCELAEYLNQFNNEITIVEMQPALAKEDVKRNRITLLKRLTEAGTKQLVNTKILQIYPDGIQAETPDGIEEIRGFDTLILALGYRNYNPLQEMAEKVCKEVYVIGDAKRARNAKFAIYEGASLGKDL